MTYNGDFFDFPFIDKRMQKYGLVMEQEIGIQKQASEEYGSRFVCHLDAFHWVNRDSYLPQGSRGLKAVTKYKLGYDPKEISPEDMLPFAQERPQEMAAYSVSDAVATYYLYSEFQAREAGRQGEGREAGVKCSNPFCIGNSCKFVRPGPRTQRSRCSGQTRTLACRVQHTQALWFGDFSQRLHILAAYSMLR